MRVNRTAFAPHKTRRDASVGRSDFLLRDMLIWLGKRHAASRKCRLHGFAKVGKSDVLTAGTALMATPTLENPFHADIQFPSGMDKSLEIDITRRLAERAELDLIFDTQVSAPYAE